MALRCKHDINQNCYNTSPDNVDIQNRTISTHTTFSQKPEVEYFKIMAYFDEKKNRKKKVQVGKDQKKAQSEKDSYSKNRGGKNQTNNQVLIP